MPLMGLDLSCTGTGICVLDADGAVLHLETVGEELTRKKLKRPATVRDKIERLIKIVDRVLRVRDQFAVRAVAVENYSYHAKGAQNDLGELGGIVKVQLWLRNQIAARPVQVNSARKKALGKGRIAKPDVVRMVRARGVQAANDNEADAWVVAEWLRQQG